MGHSHGGGRIQLQVLGSQDIVLPQERKTFYTTLSPHPWVEVIPPQRGGEVQPRGHNLEVDTRGTVISNGWWWWLFPDSP